MANARARSLLEGVINESIDEIGHNTDHLELDITANIAGIIGGHSAHQVRSLFRPEITDIPGLEGRQRAAAELLECAEVTLMLERPPAGAVHSAIFTTYFNPNHPLRHSKLVVLRSVGVIDPFVSPKISIITRGLEQAPSLARSRQLGYQLTQAFGAVIRDVVRSGEYQIIEVEPTANQLRHLHSVDPSKDYSIF